MIRLPRHLGALALISAVATTSLHAQDDTPTIVSKARAIHNKVIKIDTHVDFSPRAMTDTTPNYVTGTTSQVDIPKMENGGLDAVFFSIYVGQNPDFTPAGYKKALDADLEKFAAVHRLAEKLAPNRIEIAYTAADVRRIIKSGKKVALMGVENGYGIGEDITNVKRFFDQGARYLSLAHNGHSQLSDSNTGEADGVWKWNGLSPLGKQVVAEANKYGIMLDVSHPSKQSNLQLMALSKAPVIASHSGVRALCDHSRDMDDELLLALKKNGGVMQTVAFASYVKCDKPSAERTAAFAALNKEYGLPEATGVAGGGRAGGGGRRWARHPGRSPEVPRSRAQTIAETPSPPGPYCVAMTTRVLTALSAASLLVAAIAIPTSSAVAAQRASEPRTSDGAVVDVKPTTATLNAKKRHTDFFVTSFTPISVLPYT
ncbi:membrane dipeptidase [bacterium]|nr:membrane dipeptidase [bacterium]